MRLDRISAADIAAEHADEWSRLNQSELYRHSPFLPLWQMSSRRKGSQMEHICERVLGRAGYPVQRAGSSDHDRRINGIRVEVKGSFLWEGRYPRFTWQQIRTDQDYEVLLLLAFHPEYLSIRGATREVAHQHLAVQDANGQWPYNQHGGKRAHSGTYVMHGSFADYPWLVPARQLLGKPRRVTD